MPDLNDIYERLGGMDEKLDRLVEQRQDHEIRLRGLERWRWILIVVAAGAGKLSTILLP